MIAANNHGCFQLAVLDHFVEGKPKPVALAEANPADTCRKPLEVNPFTRHVEPVVQVRIVRD